MTMTSEREAYVYIHLPGTLETVPAALLRVCRRCPTARRSGAFAMATVTFGGKRRSQSILSGYPWARPSMSSPSLRAFRARYGMPAVHPYLRKATHR